MLIDFDMRKNFKIMKSSFSAQIFSLIYNIGEVRIRGFKKKKKVIVYYFIVSHYTLMWME